MAWLPDSDEGAKTEVIRQIRLEESRQQGKMGPGAGVGNPRTERDKAISQGRLSGLREALMWIEAEARYKKTGEPVVLLTPQLIIEAAKEESE